MTKLGMATMLVTLLMITTFSGCIGASVDAGEVGVRFDRLGGGVEDREIGEGWHLKSPLVKVITYSVKTQEYTMSIITDEGVKKGDDRIEAISKDSLSVGFDTTILYKIVPAQANILHQTLGEDYADIIIRPATRTVIRDVASEYDAMEMHQKRPEIADKIYSALEPTLAEKNIILEKVLVRHIARPEQIEQAIRNKLEMEQEAQQMEFVIQKEVREKERKIIEAEGISEANRIISGSLTSNYLTWYWIENLDKHESVLYVPVGDRGMPLIKEVK